MQLYKGFTKLGAQKQDIWQRVSEPNRFWASLVQVEIWSKSGKTDEFSVIFLCFSLIFVSLSKVISEKRKIYKVRKLIISTRLSNKWSRFKFSQKSQISQNFMIWPADMKAYSRFHQSKVHDFVANCRCVFRFVIRNFVEIREITIKRRPPKWWIFTVFYWFRSDTSR